MSVVRLDDLAEPVFPAEVIPIRAALAEAGASLTLDADALMAAARSATGLDDFGDSAFVPRLRLLARALEREGRLSDAGRFMAHALLVQLLASRLKIAETLRRHPAIGTRPVREPIVVVGLPRTGTTHLHNLLAADPALRSLPYWESLEPVLLDHERADPDPRLARCAQALAFVNACMPHFVRMHEMTPEHAHEEIQLLAIDVSTMLFETMGLLPSWRDAYRAADQTSSYAYLRTVLQVLQWSRGGTRWVLKSPQHLEQIAPLVRTFPDATVVFTHRDPAAVIASYVTMAAYTMRMHHAPPIDLRAVGRYWRDRIEDLFRACVRDRHLVPADRSLDVRFDDFMRDDLAMVRRVYDLARQPITPEASAGWAAFMATHPRGVHGTVEYDLARFGLDADEIRRACAFYTERFGV